MKQAFEINVLLMFLDAKIYAHLTHIQKICDIYVRLGDYHRIIAFSIQSISSK